MKLGIIGVGHLSVSILKGLLRAGWSPADVLLSPRGRGAEMAAQHGFGLAPDNETVVRRCDLVLLAVRPAAAPEAMAGLPWREGQVLMSACAGVPISRLAPVADAAHVVRIMPITASELGASPTLVFPRVPQVEDFLAAIGSVIELTAEDQFDAATVSAAIYGWAQALIRSGAEWSQDHGLDEATARQLVARTFVAAGRLVAEKDTPMQDLMSSIATPGGITEAGLIHLRDAAVPEAWEGACDIVMRKLRPGS